MALRQIYDKAFSVAAKQYQRALASQLQQTGKKFVFVNIRS